jgi:hypothetical protein
MDKKKSLELFFDRIVSGGDQPPVSIAKYDGKFFSKIIKFFTGGCADHSATVTRVSKTTIQIFEMSALARLVGGGGAVDAYYDKEEFVKRFQDSKAFAAGWIKPGIKTNSVAALSFLIGESAKKTRYGFNLLDDSVGKLDKIKRFFWFKNNKNSNDLVCSFLTMGCDIRLCDEAKEAFKKDDKPTPIEYIEMSSSYRDWVNVFGNMV